MHAACVLACGERLAALLLLNILSRVAVALFSLSESCPVAGGLLSLLLNYSGYLILGLNTLHAKL